MNTFITIMGWLCLAFILLSVLCGAVGLAGIGIGKITERFEWAVAEKTRNEIGRAVLSSSHWFGESKETAQALQILGDRLVKGYGVHADGWREDWRAKVRTAVGKTESQ